MEFRTQTQPVTIESVQKLIPPNSALVEIALYRTYRAKVATQSDRN